jgi:predicted nucleic acid-binding protein
VIVVSNASPFRYLVLIDAVHVLPRLFHEVVIPPAVQRELVRARTPQAVREFMATPPEWLKVREPTIVDPTLKVHAGEAQAILLAKELNATRLLIDDRKAIEAAHARGVKTTRTPALLVLAAEQQLIDLKQAFTRLKQTNFRASPTLLDEILRDFSQRHLR